MQLLTFAHSGEAQSFIRQLDVKSVPTTGTTEYHSESVRILITGEGTQNASESVTTSLARDRDTITEVINIGIAGRLIGDLDHMQTVEVRTVYGELSVPHMQFKSFTSASDSQVDCVTSVRRVLDDAYADQLRPFAQLVDRELWAIASACKRFLVPFRSIKLVSDTAGASTDCFDLKNRAESFSDSLFSHFLTLSSVQISVESDAIEFPEAFYLTRSLRHELTRKINDATARYQLSVETFFAQPEVCALIDADMSGKERSRLLNHWLDRKLFPHRSAVRDELDTASAHLKDAGWSIQFDPVLESDAFTIRARITHPKEWERLRDAMAETDPNVFSRIINGREND